MGGLVCEFGVGEGGLGGGRWGGGKVGRWEGGKVGRWGGGKVGRGEGKVRNLRVRNGSLFCTSPI